MITKDVVIIGAGAAGLMCAIEAAKRGRSVTIIEKNRKIGAKIFISGGGRCNFTNLHTHDSRYLSGNKHFCKSALARYTHWDFIGFISAHNLSWHEKESKGVGGYSSDNNQGQLFCDQKAQAIIDALVAECHQYNVTIEVNCTITEVESLQDKSQDDKLFVCKYNDVDNNPQQVQGKSLVVACGGPSIPKMGASDFALSIAKQFNIKTHPFVAALVPFTLSSDEKQSMCLPLAGVSLWVGVKTEHTHYGKQSFKENMLITHKGLSGPAILQISSYWQPGQSVEIDFMPEHDALEMLQEAKTHSPNKMLSSLLKPIWPSKWLKYWLDNNGGDISMQAMSNKKLQQIVDSIHRFQLTPSGTEGMPKAEVCTGGIDCNEISSQTMMAKNIDGLYFVGEAVDVTGFLGGYNFQWAWSSGWCAGQVV